MPEYVDPWRRSGSLQPIRCSGARLYGFVLRADAEALDDLARRYLRNPSGGRLDYEPLRAAPHIFVTFAHIARIQPAEDEYAALGWMDEMEVAFWVPMSFRRPGARLPERFPMFLPHLFVDRSMAMLQGRELYGFPKQMASFESTDTDVPDAAGHDLAGGAGEDDAGAFTSLSATRRARLISAFRRSDFEPGGIRVHAFGVPEFGFNAQWQPYPLIELLAPSAPGQLRQRGDWKSHDDLSRELRKPLIGTEFDDLAAAALADVNKVFPFEAHAVFLKQLYGAKRSSNADYQAIVEAAVEIEEFQQGGELEGDYRLRIATSDTHPIVRDLGLVPEDPEQPDIFKPELSWWADMDFRFERGETIWSDQRCTPAAPEGEKKKKRKIAILGGGIGAVSAAFWLTHPGNPHAHDVEVTLYQLGWRLGGKCASGRNADRNQRIEERGMHALFGYYYNTLRMLRDCMSELARTERGGHDLFHRNFEAQNQVVLGDRFGDDWRAIKMTFPPRRKGGKELDAGEYVRLLCKWIGEAIQATPLLGSLLPARPEGGLADHMVDFLAGVGDGISDLLGAVRSGISPAISAVEPLDVIARATCEPEEAWLASLLHSPAVLELLGRGGNFVFGERRGLIGTMIERLRKRTWAALQTQMDRNPDTRILWIGLDLAFAALRGIFEDDVLVKGYDSLDHVTFGAWLEHHGAAPATVHSPFVRSLCGSGFAFPDGDTSRMNSAAGMVLRNTLRMLFGYRDAFLWKMRAGMGDVIFAPLYEVLAERGVKFEFFHRVRALEPSEDGTRVARIRIGRQVELASGNYDPLIDVKGRQCWPHRPLYDQIAEPDATALRQLQELPEFEHLPLLESYWSPWDQSREKPVVLEHGRDFDDVVLGISLGALPSICGELAQRSERWRDMFENVKTVRTQAFQLWMGTDLDQLTSKTDGSLKNAIATAYQSPIDSWSDFTQTAAAEDWPPEKQPALIGYFCGVMADDPVEPQHFSDPHYPESQRDKTYRAMERVVGEEVRHYWPGAVDQNGFRYDLLVTADGRDACGNDRLKEQYWTANMEPHDRYVLSVAGSLQYRLRPEAGQERGASGFDNLYLAGDWTRTGLNAGFVESAVVSGMQASRAATTWPRVIEAENDLRPKKR
ncbi:MAG: NAD(P)-binding protein [Deltaproteobacteria bacterium]|nr:NAD(P)-binding protein [Deltaproteobacteria bacterium]